jgi:prepilin-type N-terminal cleavage/methylation domain-containing protein
MSRCRAPRGLTLLEMLVTLVIVGLVAGVVGQALLHLARIERLLSGNAQEAMADTVRAQWVRSTLTAMLPGDTARGDRFIGRAQELEGASADTPLPGFAGVSRVRLRLVFDAGKTLTELQLDDPSLVGNAAAAAPVVLMAWPGRSGRFLYLDSAGRWQEQWSSAAGSLTPALPVAIALESGAGDTAAVLVAPTKVAPRPAPTRRQLESM